MGQHQRRRFPLHLELQPTLVRAELCPLRRAAPCLAPKRLVEPCGPSQTEKAPLHLPQNSARPPHLYPGHQSISVTPPTGRAEGTGVGRQGTASPSGVFPRERCHSCSTLNCLFILPFVSLHVFVLEGKFLAWYGPELLFRSCFLLQHKFLVQATEF